ncbi:MAG: hypothetical protein AB8D52_09095 [Gammaproteobacteria bacterium]
MNYVLKLGILLSVAAILTACSEEQQNKLSRIGVSWLEGNYKVTYADGTHVKEWIVIDSKVTSEPGKGYYFFWATVDDKKKYVQTPISRSYIEEIDPD